MSIELELHELPPEDLRQAVNVAEDQFMREDEPSTSVIIRGICYQIEFSDDCIDIDAELANHETPLSPGAQFTIDFQ